MLIETLVISVEIKPKLLKLIDQATSFKYLAWSFYTTPIFLIGSLILVSSGYPLHGFAKFFIALGSISLYFASAIGFGFIIFTIKLFRKLEIHYQSILMNKWRLIKNFDSLNSFFILSSGFATAALVAAFRGTLTAGFTFPIPIYHQLFTYTLVLFLPTILFYSFYPRYVFRKIFDHDIYMQIEKLETEIKKEPTETIKERLELEKTLADVKEKMMLERRSIPIVSFKDIFSIAMAIVMLLQLYFQKDPVIRNYLDFIFRTN